MREVIYLVMNRRGVVKMTKSLVPVRSDEIVVKMTVTVPEGAFRPPVVEQSVIVEDWRDGADLEDVQFKRDIITAEEAGLIRERRVARMREILEQQGYKILSPDEPEGIET